MSENSIEFSLSNSEQRDSWLNSGHRTLDTDTATVPCHKLHLVISPLILRQFPQSYGQLKALKKTF